MTVSDAAIGLRMHSGWGALIVVNEDVSGIQILDRRKIVIVDPMTFGAGQPYHFAATASCSVPEEYLRHCAEVSERLALEAIRNVSAELSSRHYRIKRAAILLSSGRALPPLAQILASHPLIHTAEGVFFRTAVWTACERLLLSVSGIRECDLIAQTWSVFGKAAPQLQRRIAGFRSSLGSPWTEDQKKACLAASIVLRYKADVISQDSKSISNGFR